MDELTHMVTFSFNSSNMCGAVVMVSSLLHLFINKQSNVQFSAELLLIFYSLTAFICNVKCQSSMMSTIATQLLKKVS